MAYFTDEEEREFIRIYEKILEDGNPLCWCPFCPNKDGCDYETCEYELGKGESPPVDWTDERFSVIGKIGSFEYTDGIPEDLFEDMPTLKIARGDYGYGFLENYPFIKMYAHYDSGWGMGAGIYLHFFALPENRERSLLDLQEIYARLTLVDKWSEKEKEDFTSLMLYSGEGQTEKVRRLVESGADLEARDYNDSTALMWAAEAGNLEVVKILVGAGAHINAAIVNGYYDGYSEGKTALMFAAEGGYVDVVQKLLDAGASPNRVTAEGDSALEFARQDDNPMVIQMLEQAVAPRAIRMLLNLPRRIGRILKVAGAKVRSRFEQEEDWESEDEEDWEGGDLESVYIGLQQDEVYRRRTGYAWLMKELMSWRGQPLRVELETGEKARVELLTVDMLESLEGGDELSIHAEVNEILEGEFNWNRIHFTSEQVLKITNLSTGEFFENPFIPRDENKSKFRIFAPLGVDGKPAPPDKADQYVVYRPGDDYVVFFPNPELVGFGGGRPNFGPTLGLWSKFAEVQSETEFVNEQVLEQIHRFWAD